MEKIGRKPEFMSAGNFSISSENPAADNNAADVARPHGHRVLQERWPALARAIGQYDRQVADDISNMAYDCVQAGIIRLDDRRRLARAAQAAGIRPFDAQLLIACALRQWVLDHAYDPTPSKDAPALSFEYKAWWRTRVRLGLVAALAVALEAIILWKWLSWP